MRPVLVVVAHELTQHGPEMLLVQHDDVVQALSPQHPDDAFRDRVRTRCPNGCGYAVDTDPSGSLAKVAAVDGIAIAQQVARLLTPGGCFDQLPPHPGRGWVRRHADMHQLAPAMRDEDQHVQRLERQGRHREQVGSPQMRCSCSPLCKRPPGGRMPAVPRMPSCSEVVRKGRTNASGV